MCLLCCCRCCCFAGMYVASRAKPSPMSQQTCSMRELCIRLLALAVAGRAQQGQQQQLQQLPEQANGQQSQASGQPQQPQQPQQDVSQQRRSLSPEVTAPAGIEAVAERLRQALALSEIGKEKLQPKHLERATQVRPGQPSIEGSGRGRGSSNGSTPNGELHRDAGL
jgi:glucose/arabinose dehydrogenase